MLQYSGYSFIRDNKIGCRMNNWWLAMLRIVGVAVTAVVLSSEAWAALGRSPQPSPQNPNAHAATRYSASVPVKASYAISTTILASGTTVTEFANAAGQVFAVSWVGPLMPDLAQFFGDYFVEYQQAVQQQRAAGQRGGVIRSSSPNLILMSRGRMGRFEGHAYLSQLVPADVNIEKLLR